MNTSTKSVARSGSAGSAVVKEKSTLDQKKTDDNPLKLWIKRDPKPHERQPVQMCTGEDVVIQAVYLRHGAKLYDLGVTRGAGEIWSGTSYILSAVEFERNQHRPMLVH